jgi:hypothetical protein
MKNVIRSGLAVGIAGALELGAIALAQHGTQSGTSGDSTMSGSSSATRKVDDLPPPQGRGAVVGERGREHASRSLEHQRHVT